MKNISYPYIGKVNTEIPLLHIVTYKSNVITIENFFWEIEKQPKMFIIPQRPQSNFK